VIDSGMKGEWCGRRIGGCKSRYVSPRRSQAATRAPVGLRPQLGGPHRPAVAATFRVADASLPTPLVFVTYGDTRFTDPAETTAFKPGGRAWHWVARVAHEEPAAIFVNGDLTWHGVPADYAEYRKRDRGLARRAFAHLPCARQP